MITFSHEGKLSVSEKEKSLFPLPSLKQYDDGKACPGWHRFELEVNGDVLGGFDFEVTAPSNRETV